MAINFAATLDNKNILASINEARQAINRLGEYVDEMGESVDDATSSIKEMIKQAAALGGISLGMAGVKEFLSQMISVRKEMQGFQISLETLLGDKDKANEMFGSLKDFASSTPLMLNSLASGAQTMLGFGIASERVVPTLKEIGDVTMGDGQKFNSLVLAFSQMSAQGKLMAQDFNQMINVGFNPLQEISAKTGKSIGELKDEMSAGAISAEMVAEALNSATSEGGKFFGMLEKQGAGLAGQLNTLSGALDDMYNSLAESSEGAIASAISGITLLVQNYDKVGKAIATMVASYGTYKAALMVTTALESIRAAGLKDATHRLWLNITATKAATVAQTLYNAAVKANPYVIAATALVSVAGLMWTFAKNTDDAADAQARLNNKLNDFDAQEDELKRELRGYIGIVQDQNATSNEQRDAYDKLKEKCHELTDEYSLEELAVLGLKDAYEKLEAAQQARRTNYLQDQREQIEQVLAAVRKAGGSWSNVEKNSLAYLESNGFTGKSLKQVEQKLMADLADWEGKLADHKQKLSQSMEQTVTTTYQQDAKTALDGWKTAKAEYDKLIKSETATAKQVQAARDKMNAADAAYEKLTGKKASSLGGDNGKKAEELAANAKKLRELQEKQAKDDARAARDMELNTEQAKIDAMKEGTAKTLAQIKLDYEKEKEAIKREEEDLRDLRENNARELWEAQNAELIKKNADAWKTSGAQANWRQRYALSQEDQDYFAAKVGAADANLENRTKQETEASLQILQDYLASYGNYEEQKKAISDKYQKQIEQAQADANDRLVQILEAQMNRDLAAVDDKFGQAEKGVEGIFTDLEMASTQSVQKAIDAYEKLLQYMKNGTLSKNEQDDLMSIGFSATFIDQVQTGAVDVEALKDALKNLKQQSDNSQSAIQKLGKAWKDAFDGSKSPEDRMDALFSAMQSVQSAVGMVTSAVGTMASAFGNAGLADVMGDIDNVMNTTMSMAQQGAAIAGPWGAAAGAAMGMASSMAQVFSQRHDDALEKNIERAEKKIKKLDKSFEDLQDIVDDTFGQTKSDAIDAQVANLEQQNRLIREQISMESQKKNADQSTIESYKDAIDENTKRIKELREEAKNAIFGEDLKSAIENFASAYAEAWANNTNRTRAAKDTVRSMMKQMVNESIKAAIEASGAMEKIRAKMEKFYKDGIISDAEQNAIYREAQALQQELDKQFGWADNLFDNTQDFSSGTSGGFQAMSQESADELNGRFAAGQITMEGILQESMLIYAANQQMVTLSTEGNEVLKEMRNLMIAMGSSLADVATYTKALTTFGAKFDQMNRQLAKL